MVVRLDVGSPALTEHRTHLVQSRRNIRQFFLNGFREVFDHEQLLQVHGSAGIGILSIHVHQGNFAQLEAVSPQHVGLHRQIIKVHGFHA